MKANARTVIDLILKQGLIEGKIPEIPKYKMKFAALWSLSDTEQADIAQKKAATEQTKAQTAQVYIDSGVLDPSEVRNSLATEGEFDIEEVITEDDLNLPEDTFSPTEMSGTSENDDFDLQFKSEAEDGTDTEEPQSLLSRTAKSYVQAAGHQKVSVDRAVTSRTEKHPRRQHSERHRRSLISFP